MTYKAGESLEGIALVDAASQLAALASRLLTMRLVVPCGSPSPPGNLR